MLHGDMPCGANPHLRINGVDIMGKNKRTQKKVEDVKFLGTYCPRCGSTDVGVVYKPQYIREVDYHFCYDCGAILQPAQSINNNTESVEEIKANV